jgi:glycosyltransferase involved in cell wall biosynthesis
MTPNSEPLVSIVVPVFRVEDYIDACVESITSQTYPALEIILIDDGSDDSCGEKCDLWAVRDKRVTVVHQANGGLARARNAGIELARGDYFTFVDGDDVLDTSAIERLVHLAESVHAEVSMAQLAKFGNATVPAFAAIDGVQLTNGLTALRRIVDEGCGWEACGKLYASHLIRSSTRFQETLFEDLLFTTQVLSRASRVARTEWYLYGYRTRTNSIMSQAERRLDPDLIRALQECIDYCQARFGHSKTDLNALLSGYVMHATTKLEKLDDVTVVASSGYVREYKRFVKKNWMIVATSHSISLPYRLVVAISMVSPTSFRQAVRLAHKLKGSILPNLRRRNSQ